MTTTVDPLIIEQIMHADALASHRSAAVCICAYLLALPEGTPMPPRRVLADALGVSGYTVRIGLRVLVGSLAR
jgi:hypothetical protein